MSYYRYGHKFVVCELCGKSVKSKTIKIHVKRVHHDLREEKCQTCGKLFGTKKDLTQHMR